ncbi:hypothetical protein HXX76_014279 [Chlamydomonas incerta]|uniref:Protein kinase domain-containing protein n=1 Tax=Chlamydomonas incerta TaxID=51695 RepID=A0A835SCE9_CHLIN|nr:hypothetical protein HXX76_014279 [Chlamydomonas incerta]|eukprot:KAG2424703.1 hypothetical protein HXX76_014279 [Chlamydomonas incerta]
MSRLTLGPDSFDRISKSAEWLLNPFPAALNAPPARPAAGSVLAFAASHLADGGMPAVAGAVGGRPESSAIATAAAASGRTEIETALDSVASRIRSVMAQCEAAISASPHSSRGPRFLGKGAFGAVFLGTYHNLPVAIKTINFEPANMKGREKMANEVALSMALSHPCIVPTYNYELCTVTVDASGREVEMMDGSARRTPRLPLALTVPVGNAGLRLRIYMQFCEGGSLASALRSGCFTAPAADTAVEPPSLVSPSVSAAFGGVLETNRARALAAPQQPWQRPSSPLPPPPSPDVARPSPAAAAAAFTRARSGRTAADGGSGDQWPSPFDFQLPPTRRVLAEKQLSSQPEQAPGNQTRRPQPPEQEGPFNRRGRASSGSHGHGGRRTLGAVEAAAVEAAAVEAAAAGGAAGLLASASHPIHSNSTAGLRQQPQQQPAPAGADATEKLQCGNLTLALVAALDVARGLEYLHASGVVHGDINDTNILLKAATPVLRHATSRSFARPQSEAALLHPLAAPRSLPVACSAVDVAVVASAVAADAASTAPVVASAVGCAAAAAMGARESAVPELATVAGSASGDSSSRQDAADNTGSSNTRAASANSDRDLPSGTEANLPPPAGLPGRGVAAAAAAGGAGAAGSTYSTGPSSGNGRRNGGGGGIITPQRPPSAVDFERSERPFAFVGRTLAPPPLSRAYSSLIAGINRTASRTAMGAGAGRSMGPGAITSGGGGGDRGPHQHFLMVAQLSSGLEVASVEESASSTTGGQGPSSAAPCAAASGGGGGGTRLAARALAVTGYRRLTELATLEAAAALLCFTYKIGDMGLAVHLNGATHVSNLVQGTPFFAAPEVMSTGHFSPAADVYSFGVLLFLLLHGVSLGQIRARLPRYAFLSAEPTLRALAATELPPAARALLWACLESDPTARPTAAGVRERLEGLLRDVAGEELALLLLESERREVVM